MAINDFESAPVVDDRGAVVPPPEGAAEVVEAEQQKQAEAAGETAEPDGRDDKGRFRGRRARSHEAGAEDVPRISKLSSELREERVARRLDNGMRDVDAIIADIYPQATDDEKARHRKTIEAQVTGYTPKKAEPAKAATLPPPIPPASSDGFADPEPKLEQFADQPDPYQAHVRALGRWDAKKEAFEAKQAETAAARTAAETARTAKIAEIGKAWEDRKAAAIKADATWDTATKATDAQIPSASVLAAAILFDEDGPAMLRFLSSHQDVLDECLLITPVVTDATIAAMRRRLHSRMSGGKTGAPAPTTVTPPARPPTPVKTLATVPVDDAPDPDDTTAFFDRRKRERIKERRH